MTRTSLLSKARPVIDAVGKSRAGLSFGKAALVLVNPSPATVSKILKELVTGCILQKKLSRKDIVWGGNCTAGRHLKGSNALLTD